MRSKFSIYTFRLLAFAFWILVALPAHADDKWGPFAGRFVDVDTGEPIAGAVAIVIWLQNVPNPVQGQQDFYDARVAVANASGEFEIPRREPPFFTFRIEMPRFDYTAPGYVLWNIDEVWKKTGVVKMKKRSSLRREQLYGRLRGTGRAGMIPIEKGNALLDLVNIQRKQMGLAPLRTLEGD